MQFVDLPVSFFDPAFNLNPDHYLASLFADDNIVGFRSEGMRFLFRFEHCREVIFNRSCQRATGDPQELAEREAIYAERYPVRAAYFAASYNQGEPDLKFKAAVGRFVADVTDEATFDGTDGVFEKLSGGGRLENYVEEVSLLPMGVFFDACRLTYDREQILALHESGCAFLKSLDNFRNEQLIAACEAGLSHILAYVDEQLPHLPTDSPLLALVDAGYACGMNRDQIIANIGGTFLTAISNTVGMSSAFILRSLLRERGALNFLKAHPDSTSHESVICELLRRDNHVKALSRQFTVATQIGEMGFDAGEVIHLFFPGVNLDPARWPEPTRLNFERDFSGVNNVIFGGSVFTCIGRKLTMSFLDKMVAGFLRQLPERAYIDDEEIKMDGDWTAERIITHMPIHLS
ncbi:MAG: hypothetical protein AAGI11_18990 [Pseudomonadota bacterium]